MPLADGATAAPTPLAKRKGILRVHAADDIPTRRAIEGLLDSHTKRWTLESDDPGPGRPCPRLPIASDSGSGSAPRSCSRRCGDGLGPKLAEYSPPEAGERRVGANPVRVPTTLSALLTLWLSAHPGLRAGPRALRSRRCTGVARQLCRPIWPRSPGSRSHPAGRLLAHGDEQALIWRFNLESRQVEGRFGLVGARGLLRGDFEDIQVVGDRVFLVRSDGVIYEGRIAPNGKTSRGPSVGPRVSGRDARSRE